MVKSMTSRGGCKAWILPLVGPGWGMEGIESQLTSAVSRAPHRPRSRCRCPWWPVPHLQRAQFSAVARKDHFRSQGCFLGYTLASDILKATLRLSSLSVCPAPAYLTSADSRFFHFPTHGHKPHSFTMAARGPFLHFISCHQQCHHSTARRGCT